MQRAKSGMASSGAVRAGSGGRAMKLGGAVLLVALAALSVWLLPREIAAERLARAGPAATVARLSAVGAPADMPLSQRGRVALMRGCLEGLVGTLSGLVVGRARARLSERCAAAAETAAQEWPGHGPAFLVRAAALAAREIRRENQLALARPQRVEALLEAARRRAPAEAWQAGWRLAVAMRLGPPEALAGLYRARSDMVILSESPPGDALARLLVRHPDWREEVGAALAVASARARANVAAALRRLSGAAGRDNDG
jgi:hypothetical protein